ncbi:protein of unknown function [Caloramator quimbayensis]|uniref:Uncharacterized protein n=1 Tax=Caloramator quimbayensis TaxID=1147123 RepID=A0A1T4YA92_9CLOT|nr:DUF960 family protein [Caloramator quimbayensis]SKA98613.1 protein of unknown function [Caloramator quimbayensis]
MKRFERIISKNVRKQIPQAVQNELFNLVEDVGIGCVGIDSIHRFNLRIAPTRPDIQVMEYGIVETGHTGLYTMRTTNPVIASILVLVEGKTMTMILDGEI